jgi:3-deoxy-manno-octulosonate cytidylyltransferase (CMP-KDO synthetase)
LQTATNALIIIPARYSSTRLPGKPLLMIAGKTMLQRVCEIAQQAAAQLPGVGVLVATDDMRILEHATAIGVNAVMTPSECATGTDRLIAAIEQLPVKPNSVINFQGDSPLTPVAILTALLAKLTSSKTNTVVTPMVQLSWAALDSLRTTKQTTPFSGTTVVVNTDQEALWFSKQIIPAIRDEAKLRASSNLSPIYQHLGLYGYTLDMLQTFAKLPSGYYEQLEGLEQLRLLENGYKIHTVKVELPDLRAWRGVDTLDDAKLVEQLLTAAS